MKRVIIIIILIAVYPQQVFASLLMRSRGNITVAYTIHGTDRNQLTYPGYRSDFTTFVDFAKFGQVVIYSSIGNTTVISKPKNSMQLDKIRYTLNPGFRVEFRSWLINGSLLHECIHTIGRPENNGSTWWNSFRIGIGTKEAYFLYLPNEYRNLNNIFINKFDAQVNFGNIVEAKQTLLTGQNHNYIYELSSLIRYHVGVYRNWVGFVTLRQHLWMLRDNSDEQSLTVSINLFRKGTKKFAGIYYDYNIVDTFSLDSASKIGALGFKIIF